MVENIKKFTRYYTGIGSRQTPDDILDEMRIIAAKMSERQYIVRSGGAAGADMAFEVGAGVNHEVYLPWDGFNGHVTQHGEHVNALKLHNYNKARRIASIEHPYWTNLKESHKKLHTRNVYQVLGFDLETKSMCVMFWAKPIGTTIEGGTATAVSLARRQRIPTYNFYFQQDLDKIKRIINL